VKEKKRKEKYKCSVVVVIAVMAVISRHPSDVGKRAQLVRRRLREGLNGEGGKCRLPVKISLLCWLSVKIFDLCRLSVNLSY